ncbi:MAG TPA: anti-sigma factor [Kaistia sp.]|nr:anti-sigma factor [Kaistia sp.]
MAGTEHKDDETLTAFLDEELAPADHAAVLDRLGSDDAFRKRLEGLQFSGRGLDAAFGAMLSAAPRADLDAMLDQALARVPEPRRVPAARSGLNRIWQPGFAAALAAMLVVACLAGGIGYRLGGTDTPKQAEGWHEAVAEYWSLTTKATLALAPSPGTATQQLALASDALGIPLTASAVSLEGPSFRGAQLYEFNGKPLVQIAYLDPDFGPIAYCVIRNGNPGETQPTAAKIGDFNVVSWSGAGFGRMVIGRAPPERLSDFAARLAAEAGQGA